MHQYIEHHSISTDERRTPITAMVIHPLGILLRMKNAADLCHSTLRYEYTAMKQYHTHLIIEYFAKKKEN